MQTSRCHPRWRDVFPVSLALVAAPLSTAPAAEILPPGYRPTPPSVHALVGAKVVAKPDQVWNPGTVVIRDGLVEAVGKEIPIPAEARVWDLHGLTVYPGFIDPYVVPAATNPPANTSATEPIRSQRIDLTAGRIQFYGVPGAERDPGNRGPGSELATVLPQHRVAEDYAPGLKMLESYRELGFAAVNIVPARGILRGVSALWALSDANPNQAILNPDVAQHVVFDPAASPPKAYPHSLMGVIAALRQSFLNADFYRLDWRHYRDHPQARPRPEFNPASAALLPVLERKRPVVFEPGSALMVDRAARLAAEFHLEFQIVSSGEEWRRPDLARIPGGAFIVPVNFPEVPDLPGEEDWDQVSLDQLRAWDWAPENAAVLRRQGAEVAFTTYGLGEKKHFRTNLRRTLERGFSETDAVAALTTVPARLCGVGDRLGTLEPGKIANLTVVQGDSYFEPEAKVREVWIDGRRYPVRPGEKPKAEPDTNPPPAAQAKKKEEKEKETVALRKVRRARSPLEGRGPLAEPRAVLIRQATVWTCGPAGILDSSDLLIVDGKVRAVGHNLSIPEEAKSNAVILDGRGRHVTPGLIDCHNHSLILGAVNEGTLPSSAMVRIADVINSESVHLHQQLAGGVTVANLLHGSANPIGGQNAIVKLRDGAAPEALQLAGAPPGIKFALGENVKQSNWGDDNVTRFPQSRMGVPTFMANRFIAARRYLEEREKHKPEDAPLRRDLELEAIGEILQGRRWIHCHCYRQDEILAFLRLMERFGVRVGTLQHVLEGYKIADEIARHGAGASCFSDWWAYKFEVYDAIPYAGSLMRERGVLVSFNSDSSELARRLYLEAAKAVKYGGTPEEEALKLVTINPARQLRIDSMVGSLEPGKDGDFALWSRSPLDNATVCLQTWIDGKKYFDRDLEASRVDALAAEREQLIDKAKKLRKLSGGSGRKDAEAEKKFSRESWEHQYDSVTRHCLDDYE
jgi:imidazolonepropionase-like amidohydrolase